MFFGGGMPGGMPGGFPFGDAFGGGGMPGGGRPRGPVNNTRFYEVLEVSKEATDAELKKAHRKLGEAGAGAGAQAAAQARRAAGDVATTLAPSAQARQGQRCERGKGAGGRTAQRCAPTAARRRPRTPTNRTLC